MKIRRILQLLLAANLTALCLLLLPAAAGAVPVRVSTNPETGYPVYIQDDAQLITEDSLAELAQQMEEITAWGGAAFVTTTSTHGLTTGDYARELYRGFFRRDSGILFLIDMQNRKIWIFSDGKIYSVISKPRAAVITDNVYRYASKGWYYQCASETFSQILQLLQGGKILQPMKHISNALVALAAAMILCYAFARRTSQNLRPSKEEILGAAAASFAVANVKRELTGERLEYSPVETGGGGGGSSGGGGGSSGGGAGHSF